MIKALRTINLLINLLALYANVRLANATSAKKPMENREWNCILCVLWALQTMVWEKIEALEGVRG